MKIEGITLIRAEWNNYNGIIFMILSIESNTDERSLIGLHVWTNHFIIDILFFSIEIKAPTLR